MNAPALRPTFAELEARLAAEGFAPDASHAAPQAATDDELLPWFTRVLVGFGAWAASLFLLGFIVILFAKSFEDIAIFLGPAMIVAGVLVLRATTGATGGELFLRQGALAGTLVGQGIFIFGVAHGSSDRELVAGLAALAATLGVAVVTREPVARFLSTLGAAAALAWTLGAAGVAHTFDVVALGLASGMAALWLTRPNRLERAGDDPLASVAHALTLAFLSTLLFAVRAGPFDVSFHDVVPPGRVSTIGLGLGAVALALAIRRELRLGPLRPLSAVAIAALALLGPATPGSPGLVGAVVVLLLALHRRAPVLLGLALVFLFVFLGAHYYAMSATLLVKAATLAAAGAALVGGAFALGRKERA